MGGSTAVRFRRGYKKYKLALFRLYYYLNIYKERKVKKFNHKIKNCKS